MKQDISGVRTAQDLERKYDLGSIGTLKKNYELQKDGLNKVENELNNFVEVTIKEIEELQNQVDGNITTWFSSGVPTLNNYPASDWITTEDKNNHLGDLYYDQDTGYAYRFVFDNNIFSWLKIVDSDVTRALAIANAAQDTADSKRRVFVAQPAPPYDVGDLWIDSNRELYRCQTSKTSGIFENNDWIIATKYTDDTVANQVGANLTILSGTVTEIRDDVDELTTTMTSTTSLVNEHGTSIGTLQQQQSQTSQTVNEISLSVSSIGTNLNNNYMTSDQINAQTGSLRQDLDYTTNKMTELSTTIDGVNISIQSLGARITDMNFSFTTDSLQISNSQSKINSKFDNTGVKVYNYDKLMAIFNHNGTGVGDLIVTGSAQIGYLKFLKSTKNGKPITAIHHVITTIQSLEDLEDDE